MIANSSCQRLRRLSLGRPLTCTNFQLALRTSSNTAPSLVLYFCLFCLFVSLSLRDYLCCISLFLSLSTSLTNLFSLFVDRLFSTRLWLSVSPRSATAEPSIWPFRPMTHVVGQPEAKASLICSVAAADFSQEDLEVLSHLERLCRHPFLSIYGVAPTLVFLDFQRSPSGSIIVPDPSTYWFSFIRHGRCGEWGRIPPAFSAARFNCKSPCRFCRC